MFQPLNFEGDQQICDALRCSGPVIGGSSLCGCVQILQTVHHLMQWSFTICPKFIGMQYIHSTYYMYSMVCFYFFVSFSFLFFFSFYFFFSFLFYFSFFVSFLFLFLLLFLFFLLFYSIFSFFYSFSNHESVLTTCYSVPINIHILYGVVVELLHSVCKLSPQYGAYQFDLPLPLKEIHTCHLDF